MAQTDPVYRTFAERAREELIKAKNHHDRPALIAYLQENYQQWTLMDEAATTATMLIKSLGTATKTAAAMEEMVAKLPYHRQLVQGRRE